MNALKQNNRKKKIRALLLFSGGLDSLLALKILESQNIEVTPIFFITYFWDDKKVIELAKKLNINLRVEDISQDHLKIVINPRFGYGKGINPCIDCHLLMLKKAKEIMKKEGYDFVATGEVLKERPLSQNKHALILLEKLSSLKGYLLRPLSARLLSETIPEKKGWVKREELYAIQGKSRAIQLKLAQQFNLSTFFWPAGGCILTDLAFSKKMKELLARKKKINQNDIELLKVGRHFWVGHNIKVVVGRNHQENIKIKELKRKNDIIIEITNFPAPTTLIRSYKGKISKKIIEEAKKLTQSYSPKARNVNAKEVQFKVS